MCSSKLTPRKKERFLEHLALTGNVSKSAEYASTARPFVYELKRSDPAFAAAWDDALLQYAERLEDEADRRAVEGCVRKKFDKGIPVIDPVTNVQYEEREYSDTLLIFRLKALKPDVYAERSKNEHTGKDGGAIEISGFGAALAEAINAIIPDKPSATARDSAERPSG
jgi:hypothetical protein